MKRFTAVLVSGIAVLFLSACGGGGGTSVGTTPPVPEPAPPSEPQIYPMADRDYIFIMYHTDTPTCTSQYLWDEYESSPYFKDIVINVESNSISCATYGRSDHSQECQEVDQAAGDISYEKYDTSCVIGVNFVNPNAQVPATQEDIALEMSFILDAME